MSKRDHFKQYSQRHANAGIDATPLKFITETGEFLTGKDDSAEFFTSREMLADLDNLLEGYRKFPPQGAKNRAPIWAVLPVSAGKLPDRTLLGDMDETQWPLGKFGGKPRDPWQPVSVMPLYDLERPDTLYVFATETPSGNAAIAALMDAMAARLDNGDSLPEGLAPPKQPEASDELPVVLLNSRRINEKLYVPALHVVTWGPRPRGARLLTAPPLPIIQPNAQRELFDKAAPKEFTDF
jgi:hypothetical protein